MQRNNIMAEFEQADTGLMRRGAEDAFGMTVPLWDECLFCGEG